MDAVTVDVRAVLGELRERGARVSLEGDSFNVRPAGVVTAELAAVLRERRQDVVAYLGERPTWPCPECGNQCFPVPGTTCYWCQKKTGRGVDPAQSRGCLTLNPSTPI